MASTELRRRAKHAIDRLSGPRLRFVADLLAYVEDRQPDAATSELLDLEGFRESLARGLKDRKAGRVKDWREIRSDVYGH